MASSLDITEVPTCTRHIFYGETGCEARHASGKNEGHPCTNKAYYRQGGKVLCGVHSNVDRRKKLSKNPRKDDIRKEKLEQQQASVDRATAANKEAGKQGHVICSKMGMMRGPEDSEGYLKVFPNYKHQNRKDGFGCMALSPKSLGPIDHGQGGLPKASCLENFHQFNKVLVGELDSEKKPRKSFYNTQKAGYKSKTPQRHKFDSSKAKGLDSKEARRCAYSIFRNRQGEERRYSYVESRYFYCHFYEKLATKVADFERLTGMLADGVNLQIVGYDGFPVTRDLQAHYEDPQRPFGHELALYTLLTVRDLADYPWNRYYHTHKDIYPSYLAPGEVTPDKMDTSGNQAPE